MQENHEVSKGMYLNALSAGSTIDLETKSRHYRVEYLEGDRNRICKRPQWPYPPAVHGAIRMSLQKVLLDARCASVARLPFLKGTPTRWSIDQ
jgi:hypothetical protein